MLSLECDVLREGGPIPPCISPHSPVTLWLLDLCLCLWVWVMFASSCLSQVHGTQVMGVPLNACKFELNYKIFFLSSFKLQTHPKDPSSTGVGLKPGVTDAGGGGAWAGGSDAFTTATNPRMKHVCARAQCPAHGGPGEMATFSKAQWPRDPK